MNDTHRFTPPLGCALLMILLTLGVGVFNPGSSHAQTRVAINIDGGSGKLHPVVIELDEKNAPRTAANFKKLVAEGFYKGIAFHRVVPNYIVQMGDPLTKDPAKRSDWGTGGPGYTVPAELGQKHVRGAVAMARLSDGVNPSRASSGSQFYVCLTDIAALDGDYSVFGKVVSGLEHLDRISLVAADTNNNPISRIAVTSTRVEGDPNAGIASTVIAANGAPAPATDTGKAATGLGAKLAQRMGKSAPAADPAVPATATSADVLPTPAGVDTSIIPAPAVATTAATAAMPTPAPAPAPAPAPTAAEFNSQVAASQAAAAAKARQAAESASALPTRSPATAATPPSLPVATPAATPVNADLTQPEPNLADNMVRDRPAGAPAKPKKKEGFFTRMIKKVW